ncbi:hypothetical protein AGMMS49546_21770 [Spirochaetia bacterium]|nr:hypothetical protein AGMMS49546_21770 [Spirochaetia bacterium]
MNNHSNIGFLVSTSLYALRLISMGNKDGFLDKITLVVDKDELRVQYTGNNSITAIIIRKKVNI